MRLIFAYNCWAEYAKYYHEKIIIFGKNTDLDIIPFCLTPNPPQPAYSWNKLDMLWQRRYKPLVKKFNELKKLAGSSDILWLYNGANFHPDWLKKLPEKLLTVYGCFDDPESSHNLSEPVAPYFDACLVGNISSIPQYQGWGCHNVAWGPIFLDYEPPELSFSDILSKNRPTDLVFIGERESFYRQERLDYLSEQFPNSSFYGKGWIKGYIDRKKVIEIYKSAKIGINIHNSTGPINKRLFELPAHGIMQICDNKCRLSQIFDLNKEVVGFDNIKEAVNLIHYYLEHEKEREAIAWNGYNRVKTDYSPKNLWKYYEKQLINWKKQKEDGKLRKPKEYKLQKYFTVKRITNKAKKIINKYYLLQKNNNTQNFKNVCNKNYIQTSVEKIISIPYYENPEFGPSNSFEKEKRVKNGGFFEWPNMIALNWTVASMVGESKKIIEVGSGTGCFAYEACADPTRFALCLEAEDGARNWAIKNRKRPNIIYANKKLEDIKELFDLFVSVDVIEHINDYKTFLSESRRLAKRAIITTPNRFRNNDNALKPFYKHHVREWTAGEFYWVLRCYWSKVELFSRPDPYIPLCIAVDINTNMLDLIAICSED